MTPELRGCVFFQFPVRDTAGRADSVEPFVSKPPCSAAVSGVVYHERFVAVRCDTGLVTHYIDGFYTVKDAASGGPELYLLDQTEKLDPFAVKSFGRFLLFFHIVLLKVSTNITATPI